METLDISFVLQTLSLVVTAIIGWIGNNIYNRIEKMMEVIHSIEIRQASKFAEIEAKIINLEHDISELKKDFSESK